MRDAKQEVELLQNKLARLAAAREAEVASATAEVGSACLLGTLPIARARLCNHVQLMHHLVTTLPQSMRVCCRITHVTHVFTRLGNTLWSRCRRCGLS